MNLQAHKIFINVGLYELRLTAEADPILAGTPLHEVLGDVVEALNALKLGADFRPSLESLDTALATAITALHDWADDDAKIEEIIGELERAFLISLVVTLTSHSHLSDRVEKWGQHHQKFLHGNESHDLPHYLHVKTLINCPGPGSGRVHMQHLRSALDKGAKVFVAGAPSSTVEHYAELQSIVYAQWFTFIHAIWEEQFRGRIARFFDDPDERIRQRDVVNDFFGDVRLIRNDYVHNKGIADEAVNVKLLRWGFVRGKPLDITAEQMISMIDLFPRAALSVKPTPRPASNRARVPGSISPDVLEDVLDKISELKLDKNAVTDEAFRLWLTEISK